MAQNTTPTTEAEFEAQFNERFTGSAENRAEMYEWCKQVHAANWPTNTPADVDDFKFMAAVTARMHQMNPDRQRRGPSGRVKQRTGRGKTDRR